MAGGERYLPFWYFIIGGGAAMVSEFISTSEGKLDISVKSTIEERVNKLLKIVNEEPKIDKWIKRAKVGTSKPWYREVEEVVR